MPPQPAQPQPSDALPPECFSEFYTGYKWTGCGEYDSELLWVTLWVIVASVAAVIVNRLWRMRD